MGTCVLHGCLMSRLASGKAAARLAVLMLERPRPLVGDDMDEVRTCTKAIHGLLCDLSARSRVLTCDHISVDDRKRLPGGPSGDVPASVAHPVFEQPRCVVREPG